MTRRLFVVPLVLGLACAGAASAQQPPLPAPGAEHQLLKADVGTWDATVEDMQGGAPAKGTEVVRMTGGGLWQVSDFTSQIGGVPFEGHGTVGYDPAKKKFVMTWVDSMTTSLAVGEGTWDAAKKTLTATLNMTDPGGQAVKMRETLEYKDADNKLFTLYAPMPDGKEAAVLKITYKRRK
jgi:hypothetical protein